jgi:uncharacterized membrane protein
VSIQRGYRLVALLLLLVAGCTIQPNEAPDPDPGLDPPPFFGPVADTVATGIEVAGIAIIVVGAVLASAVFVRDWIGEPTFLEAYRHYRERLGQAILLGLEFLVAADIIGTVAVRPSFRNVGILGAIVAIRTFLSFTLEIEIEGSLPWKSEKR